MKTTGEDPNRFTLLYNWTVANWSSGNFTALKADGTSAGVYLEKYGSSTKQSDENGYYFQLTSSAYLRKIAAGGTITIPRNWMFEITFVRVASTATMSPFSWGGANNSVAQINITSGGALSDTCKPTSSTASGGVGTFPGVTIQTGVLYTIRYGCEMYSETQDLQWFEYDGVRKKASTPHAPFSNLSSGGLRALGRNTDAMKLYSFKVYTDTKTV